MRLNYILNLLSPQEQQDLGELYWGDSTNIDPKNREFFFKVGLSREQNGTFVIASNLLDEQLRKARVAKQLEITPEGKVILGETDITAQFRTAELILLQTLYNHKGTIVTRTQAAQALWQDQWEELYSDWALDKAISRVRHRLIELGLPKEVLQTKKGRGFLIK